MFYVRNDLNIQVKNVKIYGQKSGQNLLLKTDCGVIYRHSYIRPYISLRLSKANFWIC